MSRPIPRRAFGGPIRRRSPSRPGRRRPVVLWSLAAVLVGGVAPVSAVDLDSPASERTPQTEESDQAAPGRAPLTLSETVTVTGSRLRGEPEELLRTPANVTVISRQAIERAGATTLQELLQWEAGVILFDQVGNDISRTFDLRGFTGGTGTRVFLDGAPINDPRNNAVALELVPLGALERVEIARGSTAALAGGGSEAGVINLWTRQGSSFGGEISLAAGEFGTVDAGAELVHRAGRTDLYLVVSRYETDGFRDNAGGDLGRVAGAIGRELGTGRSLRLSLLAGDAEFGTPGALTAAELAADRSRARFNRPDFSDEGSRQATLNYRGPISPTIDLSVNLFSRSRASEILTTGRAAPLFGGFFLDSEAGSVGSTVQIAHGWRSVERSNRLIAGLEWLDGDTDARGFFTPPDDPGRVDPAALGSDNTAERRTLALYLQDSWRPADAWTVALGVRLDRDEVGYDERTPDAVNDSRREFSELSLRGGVNWAASDRVGLYLSFGETFLPPTVEELFSFPLFGSNPDLRPEDSRSWEVGVRARPGRATVDLALFDVETEDEIVFDPDSPRGPFGANVNAGRARRRGLEASARSALGTRLTGFLNLTLVDAEFLNGPNRGQALPLVPEERLAAGFELTLPRGFDLRARGLYVGEQPLDNDDANRRPPLAAYTVVDTRLGWTVPRRHGGAQGRRGGLSLYFEVRNLLDEEYATRGIYAFDFATFDNEVFLTPAPGRRLMGGIAWGF